MQDRNTTYESLDNFTQKRPAAVGAFLKDAYGLVIGFQSALGDDLSQPMSQVIESETGIPVFTLAVDENGIDQLLQEACLDLMRNARFCCFATPTYLPQQTAPAVSGSKEQAPKLQRHLSSLAFRRIYFQLSRLIKSPKLLMHFQDSPSIGDADTEGTDDRFLFTRDEYLQMAPYFDHCAEPRKSSVENDKPGAEQTLHKDAAGWIVNTLNASESEKSPLSIKSPSHAAQKRNSKSAPVKPNFLIIGAAKAGTSAIAAQLSQHPDLFIPDLKELHFFNRVVSMSQEEIQNAWSRYLTYFQGAQKFLRRGEATVSYTMIPHLNIVHDEIFKALGKIPLIYVVREPVDRIVSQYRHAKRNREDIEPLEEWIKVEGNMKSCLARSDYERQIAPYRDLIGDQNIKIIFYEDYQANYLKSLEEIFLFLGLSAQNITHIKNEKVNVISESIVEMPAVSLETIDFVRSMLRENTHVFLARYGKPADYWPSMA